MKAKYFKRLRNECRYYQVEYSEQSGWLCSFDNKKMILARSEREAVERYSRKTGSFINNIYGKARNCSTLFAKYRVTFRQRVTYWQ